MVLNMNSSKIKMAIESKIVSIVRIIMENSNCSEIKAFKSFKTSKVYEILTDENSGLYLEPVEFLYEAYCIEVEKSQDEMIKFINIGL